MGEQHKLGLCGDASLDGKSYMFRGQSQLGTCTGRAGGLSSCKSLCCFEGMKRVGFFRFSGGRTG